MAEKKETESKEMEVIAIKEVLFGGKKHTSKTGSFTVPEYIGKRLKKSKSAKEYK